MSCTAACFVFCSPCLFFQHALAFRDLGIKRGEVVGNNWMPSPKECLLMFSLFLARLLGKLAVLIR